MDSLAHVERIRCGDEFPVKRQAHLKSFDDYQRLYRCSIETPGVFWKSIADNFYWHTPLPADPNKVMQYNFNLNHGPIKTEFLKGVQTNITYNLLDRIINRGFGDRIAYYWYEYPGVRCGLTRANACLSSTGKATNRTNVVRSPTESCETKYAALRTLSSVKESRWATGWRSTCRLPSS